ncbi:thyroid transcription factor 1-associated protein 26-like isoform X2 [Limulus polyphemus]|uniref:Thyroid transcription factor 1-associated protein 26-like isoform X2 n=1 Tax=Limulus polyphemus TaxID=6850 RepID=A0ABM1T9E4_LIMPO|nr:thyroid transcription factor 1-associated protein 26-like isoform X2 [Limulus polyphemus]
MTSTSISWTNTFNYRSSFNDPKKKKIIHEYKKLLRKEQHKQPTTNYQTSDCKNENSHGSMKQSGRTTFHRALKEYEKKQSEKKLQQQEQQRIELERNKALQRYQQKKKDRFKKLSKKTGKGQPVMKERIMLLLEKIQ